MAEKTKPYVNVVVDTGDRYTLDHVPADSDDVNKAVNKAPKGATIRLRLGNEEAVEATRPREQQ